RRKAASPCPTAQPADNSLGGDAPSASASKRDESPSANSRARQSLRPALRAVPSPDPARPASKRRKVTAETAPREDVPCNTRASPPVAGPSSTPASPAAGESGTRIDPAQPAPKRRTVTVETVPDEEAPRIVQPTNPPIAGPSSGHTPDEAPRIAQPNNPPVAGPSSAHTSAAVGNPSARTDSRLDAGPAKPASSTNHPRRRRRKWKDLYVEDFPDPLAGAPISKKTAPTPDMNAYMRDVGPMANPKAFEAAELLMTSDMTDKSKDRHLKSSIYTERTPWAGCEEMLADVDKLPAGPKCEIHEIEVFDGTRSRVQYLVRRSIIDVIRDLVGNSALHGHFKYTPVKLYTSKRRGKRVYSEMWTANWWWNEQVSFGCRNPLLEVVNLFL
ncbi:hypothetical protein FRC07_012361, partial [Ceratobasidium sp. 392]